MENVNSASCSVIYGIKTATPTPSLTITSEGFRKHEKRGVGRLPMMCQEQMEMWISLTGSLQIILDMHWLVIQVLHECVELKMTKLKHQAASRSRISSPSSIHQDADGCWGDGRELRHLKHPWDKCDLFGKPSSSLEKLCWQHSSFLRCLMVVLTPPGCLHLELWEHVPIHSPSSHIFEAPFFVLSHWTVNFPRVKLTAIHVTLAYQECLIKVYRNGQEYFPILSRWCFIFQVLRRAIGSFPDKAVQRLILYLNSASRPCGILLNSTTLETNL